MLAKVAGFVSVVLVIAWMAYSLMGSAPLLILKHDTPDDARLIRGFFDIRYRVLACLAVLGAISFTVAGNMLLAVAMLCIASIAAFATSFLVARMGRMRKTLTAADVVAIARFRRLHLGAIGLNATHLMSFMCVLSQSALITCTDVPPDCRNATVQASAVADCRQQCSIF